jgi:hypothetical protein
LSARIVWACDECGEQMHRDVDDDAACYCRAWVGYPDGWYVGDERVACSKTACQAAVQRSDHDLPDECGSDSLNATESAE